MRNIIKPILLALLASAVALPAFAAYSAQPDTVAPYLPEAPFVPALKTVTLSVPQTETRIVLSEMVIAGRPSSPRQAQKPTVCTSGILESVGQGSYRVCDSVSRTANGKVSLFNRISH